MNKLLLYMEKNIKIENYIFNGNKRMQLIFKNIIIAMTVVILGISIYPYLSKNKNFDSFSYVLISVIIMSFTVLVFNEIHYYSYAKHKFEIIKYNCIYYFSNRKILIMETDAHISRHRFLKLEEFFKVEKIPENEKNRILDNIFKVAESKSNFLAPAIFGGLFLSLADKFFSYEYGKYNALKISILTIFWITILKAIAIGVLILLYYSVINLLETTNKRKCKVIKKMYLEN